MTVGAGVVVFGSVQASQSLIYDFIDRLYALDDAALDADGESHADRIRAHLMLLADLAGSVTPPELVDQILPFDFPDQEIAAAYRLLRHNDLDQQRARAAATHPDVAGVLEAVGRHLRIRDELGHAPTDPRPVWMGLVWRRRRTLLEIDRLMWAAEQITRAGLTGMDAFNEASRATDAAIERIWGLGDPGGAPNGLPEHFPTPRRRLLAGPHPAVALEDGAIAETLVDLIEVADRRVLLAVPWIRSAPVIDRLLAACRDRTARGVRVLLVTRPITTTRGYETSARDEKLIKQALAQAGVEIRWRRHLHDKVFVVDDTVICGSQNLTGTDIERNPNAAIGTGTLPVVEQFAHRIETLATRTGNRATKPQVSEAQLPLFAFDAYTGMSHRLAIPGDADIGALEGGGQAPTDCGEIAEIDSVSRVWAFSSGDACARCRPPLPEVPTPRLL